jgi:hypothetical protein
MDIDLILSRLKKVKKTGRASWIACCPAHQDKSPSLSVTMTDNRVLVHCFGGCDYKEVVKAIGVGYGAFMPTSNKSKGGAYDVELVRGIEAYNALQIFKENALIMVFMAQSMVKKKAMTEVDMNKIIEIHKELLLIEDYFGMSGVEKDAKMRYLGRIAERVGK